jgi:sialate O-acetylesterase
VLQRQSEVAIWGKGPAGKKISVESSWKNKASAVVDSEGSWSAKLKTAKAGGPYQVSVSDGDTTVILKDVLLGEVWLCSGQSNMAMPLEGWPPTSMIQNSDSEISNANFSNIRFFSVKRAFAVNPENSCEGKWVECNPKNVRTFSAAAYFFGRTLFQQLHIPIGLIHASWGGTAIEAWMSKQNLSKIGDYLSILKRIEEGKDSIEALKKWIAGHPAIRITDPNPETRWQHLNFDDSACVQKEFNDSLWREMNLPGLWEQTAVGNFDGAVWFRKRITIPSDWKGKELTLELGPIDDIDETYVNGRNVGNHLSEGMWQVPRRYTIPAGEDSILQIAVRVIDYGGGGGIFGSDTSLQLRRTDTTLSIPLAGKWKYLPVGEYMGGIFYVFGWKGQEYFNRPVPSIDFTGYSPTALFNGMISPLIPFTLRGAIWYQGESNVGNPKVYATLFPMMIKEWRSVFQREDMPFYYVQIAPFKYAPPAQSQLLREAQFKTLTLKNTGMVVTLDIGNPDDIHPANKQDVGKRLALWALAKTYKKSATFSGPLYRSMKIRKNTIVLSFDYVGKGLVIKEHSNGNEFQFAGEDSLFKNAVLKVEGATLVLSHPDIVHPKAVRYAFSDVSEATLFNKEGLPASSFRTDK